MSKKLSGNGLWESSRMMLPEHKERINQHMKELTRKKRPTLHEDEWEIILNNIGESLYERKTLEIHLFDPYGDRILTGVVSDVAYHLKRFKVEEEGASEWVDFRELVSVRLA
ncbi:YolD-like family protein [Paenibacillus sp. MMO-58]|uniref:YolD-like family protein n=1 Tax=Paenibacillus sp. MMO-58 TaxID=3081290 RepID=UPI00301AEC38